MKSRKGRCSSSLICWVKRSTSRLASTSSSRSSIRRTTMSGDHAAISPSSPPRTNVRWASARGCATPPSSVHCSSSRSEPRQRWKNRRGASLLPEDTNHAYVFLAGGIGITVFRSMLRYIAEEDLPHRVTLIYSNRDRASTPFLDELSQLDETRDAFQLVLTMTEDASWNGEARRIGPELLRDHLSDDLPSYAYLVAGPPGMVDSLVATLRAAEVPEERVSADRFSGY